MLVGKLYLILCRPSLASNILEMKKSNLVLDVI
jgi:hypothetical protein